MVNWQLAWLPFVSAKVYLTVVLPTGNGKLDWWVASRRVTGPEISVAEGVIKLITVELTPNSTVTVLSDGQVRVGGVLSTGFQTK